MFASIYNYNSPLDQFEIYALNIDCKFLRYLRDINYRFSVHENMSYLEQLVYDMEDHTFYAEKFFVWTNSVLYSVIGCVSIYFYLHYGTQYRHIYPKNPWHFFTEKIFLIFKDIIEQNFEKKIWAGPYFPFLFTIFFFILFMNLLGLVPYGFTNTSFIIETFTLSASMLIGLTILAVCVQGNEFFAHFIPKGIPVALIPMLVIIEVISYVSKAFSLAIRLFANLMSGHTLLNILSSFSISLSKVSIFIGLIPFIIVLAISFLEVGIALLQAYVFMILLTLYFNDTCKVDKKNRQLNLFDFDRDGDIFPLDIVKDDARYVIRSRFYTNFKWKLFYDRHFVPNSLMNFYSFNKNRSYVRYIVSNKIFYKEDLLISKKDFSLKNYDIFFDQLILNLYETKVTQPAYYSNFVGELQYNTTFSVPEREFTYFWNNFASNVTYNYRVKDYVKLYNFIAKHF